MTVDLRRVVQSLERVFSPEQALTLGEVLVEVSLDDARLASDMEQSQGRVLDRLLNVEDRLDKVETKIVDLQTLIVTLGQQVTNEAVGLDAKIDVQGANIRGDINASKFEMIRWIVGAIVGAALINIASIAGLILTLTHGKP